MAGGSRTVEVVTGAHGTRAGGVPIPEATGATFRATGITGSTRSRGAIAPATTAAGPTIRSAVAGAGPRRGSGRPATRVGAPTTTTAAGLRSIHGTAPCS